MNVTAQQKEKARYLISHPLELAHRLGYQDMTEIHDGWMRSMLRFPENDMTLQAHRGSYKTTCLCIVIALFLIRYRDKNIIFMRKTDTDTAEVVKQVLKILQTPIFMQMYYALVEQQLTVTHATSTEITLSCYSAPRGSAQLLGIGIGGSLTGKHADIVITDDIINLKDRISRAQRQKTKATYMELQNIRNPGGRIINTGTPWHKDDAFTLMPETIRFDCYHTGLLPKQKIEQLKKSMSPSLFAANYELRHIAAEDTLFPEQPKYTDNTKYIRDGIAHIDAAYGGQDFTAFTCGQRIGDTLYMYGRMWHKHIDVVLDTILADADRLMCAPVYCELNADKGYLAKEIKRRNRSPHSYQQRMNKYQKISSYLRKWWSSIVWLQGTDPEYIAQIMDYTEQAEHDDAPDSAACMCRLLDRKGYDLQL